MDQDDLVRFTSEALLLCLKVSLPVVGVAALAGLLIAFIQAVMSLQDASISFALKLVVVVAAIAVTAPWGASAIMQFGQTLMQAAFP
ncbi:type III secretion system export apparatus subunit SctS [Xanthomonas arboricola]|uniref:type III secretion system export apparatus subunit SctS n=1 Tax=Xanthomonas arboricola TaxID=56448 RepID=UPI000E0FE43D|nr:type III secretion system export apparatus subunit SctS [Xanthomonas arboricola]